MNETKMKNTKITREQFRLRIEAILKTSKKSHEVYSALRIDPEYVAGIAELEEHDPVLAQLCREADTSVVEPLLKIIKYLGSKLEC